MILPLDQVGFSRFSEFEEDGHLLYLLTLAGSVSRTVVEISSQDGRTCMATNLLVHHRWRGFLFDGDPVFVAEGRRFFARHPATRALPPVVQSEWFTRDNVNRVLASVGVPGEVDVLSLDIDGNDLHLWNAMTLRPRILICEFNNAVPSELALTIPYQADFNYAALPSDQALFRSASLAAYAAVCRRKGYRLVGINALGFNAIFLRDDVLAAEMPEIPVSALDANPHVTEEFGPNGGRGWRSCHGLRYRPMGSSDIMPSPARSLATTSHSISISRSGSWSAFRAFAARSICAGRCSRSPSSRPVVASPS